MKKDMEAFQRTAMLIGWQGVESLQTKRVAVFGIGGVGGHTCEGLARAGVGQLDLFDHDEVAPSNLNRQIVALHSTLGQKKCQVMADRILDINPQCQVQAHPVFYTPDNAAEYPFEAYDYIVDAVDTVTAKLEIITRAKAAGVPVISCMGTGNKIHPEEFFVSDITKTSMCPLARVMRRELKKRGISHVQVVSSKEQPLPAQIEIDSLSNGKTPPGSISFGPAAAGMILAGAVVRGLLEIK